MGFTHVKLITVYYISYGSVVDRHSCDANPDPDPNFHFDPDPDPDPESGYVLALTMGTDPHADATQVDKSDDFFTFNQSNASL